MESGWECLNREAVLNRFLNISFSVLLKPLQPGEETFMLGHTHTWMQTVCSAVMREKIAKTFAWMAANLN